MRLRLRGALANPKVTVSVVFVVAMFMNILDTTIVNVALPRISLQFHVLASSTATVATGYLISLAVFIPAAGWLGDRWGAKRIFLIALALFTSASALCGLAQSLSELIVCRVVQGAGGGMMMPVGLAMLYRTFPPHERMRASRILVIPTAVAPAMGPVLGGLLVDQLSWRWVFLVNVPVGLAAFAFGLRHLREQDAECVGRFDIAGFLLAGTGLGLLMYTLSQGAARGWTSPPILGAGVLSLAALCALVVVELRISSPMLDLRLFCNRLFRQTNVVMMFAFGGFFGVLFVFPLLMQDGLGLSALQSGLNTFPEAIGVMVSSQVLVSRLYPTLGPRRLMTGGALAVAILATALGSIGFSTDLWVVRLLMLGLGFSMANVFLPAQTAAFASISPAQTGQASSLFNATRQTAGALGVAVLGTVLATAGITARTAAGRLEPHLAAYHLAFFTAGGLSLVGALFAMRVHDGDAASTMRQEVEEAEDQGRGARGEPIGVGVGAGAGPA
jgi:EmrB/QacA subfamily drug resistance transporter